MPIYQMCFDTDKGEKRFKADIDAAEILGRALGEIVAELRERDLWVRGLATANLCAIWNNRQLDLSRTLPEQNVGLDETIRVLAENYTDGGSDIGPDHIQQELNSIEQRHSGRSTPTLRGQVHIGLKQTVYFMTLVGALAGLACWSIAVWIRWMPDLAGAAILGMLIGGLTVWFSDRWSGEGVATRWVLSGVGIGLAAGTAGGLLQHWIGAALIGHKSLAVIAAWTATGMFVGFGAGLRWIGVNRLRVLHALGGGLCGGGLGGVVFASWPLIMAQGASAAWIADVLRTAALVSTGAGITCGMTLAPVVFRGGVLRFVSSGDPRAENKCTLREWDLQDGDTCIAGNSGNDNREHQTLYGPKVRINVPDGIVRSRHAVLSAQGGRFFIEPHPDNRGARGQALSSLRLRGTDVVGRQQICDGDDLVIGQTLLRFETRNKRQRRRS